ncbi:MAG: phosphotransferase [Rhizobacter sp.]|nr:phosphotransferase [Rhizobacter sp.]MBP6269680.1 phosphotransferase [Rhizobacter sp.]
MTPVPPSTAPDVRPGVVWSDPARSADFQRWIATVAPAHRLHTETLRPASSDASFRRYLRIDGEARSFIVMDAPPAHEDVRPFVAVASLARNAQLNVPQVLAQDVEHGFLLLDDLGTQLYLGELQAAVEAADNASVERLMRSAMSALVVWQQRVDASALPAYDDALLRRELALFPEWCVKREFGVSWNADEQATWATTCDLLVRSALDQPTVAVHRDYMPRNLMVCDGNTVAEGVLANPGILDFQDAVRGPISYDVASMLRDAFISWDEEQELDWAIRYWQQARKVGLPVPADFGEFWKPLEWMGLQRHLKVLGIFCRLKHRDGKPAYSADLPRFFRYAHKVATRYEGLGPLARLLEPLMGATRVDAFY